MPIFFIDLGGRTHSRRVETAFMGLPLSEGSMSQLNTDTSVSFQDGEVPYIRRPPRADLTRARQYVTPLAVPLTLRKNVRMLVKGVLTLQ